VQHGHGAFDTPESEAGPKGLAELTGVGGGHVWRMFHLKPSLSCYEKNAHKGLSYSLFMV
jgi:hypothetical protein